MNNHTFANKLNSLRQTRHLTTGELATKAGVGQPLISGLISGDRVIGEYTARKIAAALQLTGRELEDFVYLAINSCSEKVLQSSKNYPSELLNLIACELQELGILPDKISYCVRKPASKNANAALYLEDGKEALIKLEVAIA